MHIWLSYNKFYIKIAYRLSICKDSLTLNKTKPLIYWELNNHANQRSEEFEIPIQGRTDTYEVTKISILGSSQDVQSPCRTQRTEQFPKKKKTDFKRFSVYFALNLSSYITYSGNVKYVTGREWRINMY